MFLLCEKENIDLKKLMLFEKENIQLKLIFLSLFFECSASVLDRLNALLEPKGILSINERGTVDGVTVNIVPHPQFR